MDSLRKELHLQLTEKEAEITELGKHIQTYEQKIQEINAGSKSLNPSRPASKKSMSSMR